MSARNEPNAARAPIDRVTVAIPSWNGRRHLETCLRALADQRNPHLRWEIAVLDNGSDDGTSAWLESEHPGVRVHRAAHNLGFAAACNRLVDESDADAVALLNNDTRPDGQWLCALVDALAAAPADVVAVAGKVVDWAGEHLDFAGGIMTFDGHAFQSDFRRPLHEASVPADGTELLFATGCNMIVRRREFQRLGGFDADYFAYLEDVDFGWRAWSSGWRILFASEAIVHHRNSATGDRLGNARRGFLFERNAFMTAYKNYDAELWSRMMPAILVTLMSRVTESLVGGAGDDHWLLQDAIGNGAAIRRPTMQRAMRRFLSAIGLHRSLSVGVRAEAHLRALAHITRRVSDHAALREQAQSRRTISDRELFERFPPYVVPTYPGDANLFGSRAFRELLPPEIPFEYRELPQVMEIS